jgi:hypothetical protein
MTLTPDETAALRRLLDRLRNEPTFQRPAGSLGNIHFERLPRALDADLFVPIIERLLKESS